MGYVYKDSFKCIGRVDSDGYIYDNNFERLGRIQSDGYIYDNNFEHIGRIESDGFIYLANMKRIGRIHRDGYVYDELFNRVGKLDSDIIEYIFHDNSKIYQSITENQKKSSYNDGNTGNSGGGCAIFSIPFGIFIIWLFVKVLKSGINVLWLMPGYIKFFALIYFLFILLVIAFNNVSYIKASTAGVILILILILGGGGFYLFDAKVTSSLMETEQEIYKVAIHEYRKGNYSDTLRIISKMDDYEIAVSYIKNSFQRYIYGFWGRYPDKETGVQEGYLFFEKSNTLYYHNTAERKTLDKTKVDLKEIEFDTENGELYIDIIGLYNYDEEYKLRILEIEKDSFVDSKGNTYKRQ